MSVGDVCKYLVVTHMTLTRDDQQIPTMTVKSDSPSTGLQPATAFFTCDASELPVLKGLISSALGNLLNSIFLSL